jgi:hypothetical protein
MGALDYLEEEDLRRGAAGISEHSSRWRRFYGKESVDRKLNLMLDEVQDLVGEGKISQLLIHDKECPSCRASLPKFEMVAGALTDRLPGYQSAKIELNEVTKLPGASGTVRGMEIFRLFQDDTKGVPFVIQNAEVVPGPGGGRFSPAEEFFVVFVGKLDPFRFLATSFNIDNLRVQG